MKKSICTILTISVLSVSLNWEVSTATAHSGSTDRCGGHGGNQSYHIHDQSKKDRCDKQSERLLLGAAVVLVGGYLWWRSSRVQEKGFNFSPVWDGEKFGLAAEKYLNENTTMRFSTSSERTAYSEDEIVLRWGINYSF